MSGAEESAPERAGGSASYREASILFADIVGFGALARARGADEAYLVVTRCLRILDDVARRHGGAVDKYLGDCLMAVFGFPLTPAEAAAAAARAALEMRLSVREVAERIELPVDLDVKVGLEAGPVLAGALGDSVVREFSVLGRCVNHAARIKSLAPAGTVYAGAGLAALLGNRFVMREVGAVKLQGVRDLARPREILEAQRDDDAPFGAEVASYAPFVGREAELAQLDARVHRQAAGEGGLVAIEGPPGAGKSRLLLELTRRHPERRIRALPPAGSRMPSVEGGIFVVDDGGRRTDLAAVLADLPPSTLVFVAGRSPLPDAAAKAVERARAIGEDPLELALGPLDDAAIGALVDALPEHVLEPEARALVVRRAAGNPGRAIQSAFLAETLQADEARASDYSERADDAERRRATVLFADLSGFTALAESMEADALHPLVSDCLDRLSGIARRHGGTVEKYLGDCVMAVFGVPVSIEDAPRAAINASIEMRRAVATFNEERGLASPFGIHIGIDTGLGIAGEVSGPLIREYSLMGESVSGAARLEDLSPPGSIFVGEETARATRDDFDYAPVGADGEAAYELRSETTKLHRSTPSAPGRVRSVLVGRDAELAALNRATRELAAGTGGIVSVVAEAGIGKSRLLAEALPAEARGFRWLKGRSLSNGRTLGHHPFADLFADWCGADDDEPKAALAEKLTRTAAAELGSEAEEVVPFLSTLLGAPLPEEERERFERLAPEALEPLLLAAITRTLQGMARREPVALVFEDLHWADASSIELLTSLLRLAETEPILFLLVTRPGWPETADRVRAAARERLPEAYTEITLAPLDAGASMELLRNLFRGADVPHALRTAIEQRATGNPFYAEEVVRGLRDAGALEERGGRLVATPRIHEVAVPGTLQEVVMARVDRLGREGRDLLRVASAIGFAFEGDVLADVEGRAVEGDLARLETSEMIERREGRAGEFQFKHPLIQEVVYDSMLEGRRSELHGQVGRAVEARLDGDEPGAHAMLAHHFSRAGDVERAEHHLFAAGDEAARSAASDEALRFFEDAAALFRNLHGEEDRSEKLGLLERNMALALVNRGRYAEAILHFDAALECHGVVGAKQPIRRNLRLVRDLALILGRVYFRRFGRARRGATETERQIQELVYERARAQTTNATDRYLFDWMDAVRRLGDVDPRTLPLAGGQFASSVGIFSFGGVSFAISERFLAQARELVDADDPEERMIYGMMNATHQTLAGDWSAAHELPVDFLEDRIRDGQLFDVTNYLGLQTERRIMQGRFEEARTGIARLEHVAELFQFEQAKATVRALETFLALEREEWERAIEAAEAHFSEQPDPLPNLLALGNKAKAQLGLGRREEAERSLTAAESLLSEATAFVPPFHKAVVLRSRLLCELDALAEGRGDRQLARRVARQALRAGGWVALRRPEIQRLEGTRRSLIGDARGARRWWLRARAEAEALGMLPEVERVDRALAGMGLRGPRA